MGGCFWLSMERLMHFFFLVRGYIADTHIVYSLILSCKFPVGKQQNCLESRSPWQLGLSVPQSRVTHCCHSLLVLLHGSGSAGTDASLEGTTHSSLALRVWTCLNIHSLSIFMPLVFFSSYKGCSSFQLCAFWCCGTIRGGEVRSHRLHVSMTLYAASLSRQHQRAELSICVLAILVRWRVDTSTVLCRKWWEKKERKKDPKLNHLSLSQPQVGAVLMHNNENWVQSFSLILHFSWFYVFS